MTDYLNYIEPRRQLSFSEAQILFENMTMLTTQISFIARLDLLLKNTQDERLSLDLDTLLSKVRELTPLEFEKLKQDTLGDKVIFPPDYCI